MTALPSPPLSAPPFPALLRSQRTRRDLSQQALAAAVGISREMIKQMEGGRRRPSKQLAARLADYFGLSGTARAIFLARARARRPGSRPAPLPAAHTALNTTEIGWLIMAILAQNDSRLDLPEATYHHFVEAVAAAAATALGYRVLPIEGSDEGLITFQSRENPPVAGKTLSLGG